jgi:hypothetical protein
MAQKRTNWLRFSRIKKTMPLIKVSTHARPAATFGVKPVELVEVSASVP